jgi:hypothetical protein
MSEAEKLKRKFRGRVAVKPGPAAKALGIGRYMLQRMIDEGTVPVNAFGNIPADWLLQQMKIKGGKAAA